MWYDVIFLNWAKEMESEHIIPLDMAAENFGVGEIERLIKWLEEQVILYESTYNNKRTMFLVTRPYKKMLREISFSTKGRKSLASRRTFEANWEKICDMIVAAVETIWELEE